MKDHAHAQDLDKPGTRPLPKGWRWVRLGEVCQARIETRDPRREPTREFKYVDIGSIDNKAKCIAEPRTLPGKDAPSRARQIIRKDDVLVATTRPNLNAVALVPRKLDGQICSTGFCVLRVKAEMNPRYLFAFVQSTCFVSVLSELVKGALYPAVTDAQVRNQMVPLPPLAEQKRIAAILKEQLAAVGRARAAAEAQLDAAQSLSASFLCKTFERVGGKSCPRMTLGEILHLRKEIVHPRDNPRGRQVFVGLEHLEPNTGRRLGQLEVEMANLTGRKPRFHRGDIVYGYLRPYLNKVWIAEFDGLCSVDQYVYSMDGLRFNTEFVACFMRSPVFLRRAPIHVAPGYLPRIRTEEVAAVELDFPPLQQQVRIMERLSALMAKTGELRAAFQAQCEAVTALPSAILRQAFSGEL